MYGMWWQICIIGGILLKYSPFSHGHLCNFGCNLLSINLLTQLHKPLSSVEHLLGRSILVKINKWIKSWIKYWKVRNAEGKPWKLGYVSWFQEKAGIRSLQCVLWLYTDVNTHRLNGKFPFCLLSGNYCIESILWDFSKLKSGTKKQLRNSDAV